MAVGAVLRLKATLQKCNSAIQNHVFGKPVLGKGMTSSSKGICTMFVPLRGCQQPALEQTDDRGPITPPPGYALGTGANPGLH